MCPKCFLFCFLTTLTVSLTSSQVCQVPDHIVKITADQLQGTWSHQMNSDSDKVYFDFGCDKEEYTFTTPTTGSGVNTACYLRDMSFRERFFNVSVLSEILVSYVSNKQPNVIVFMYIILWKESEFVGSVCYYDNNVLIQQYGVVMSRAQTKSQAHSEALMREAGVNVTKPYFYSNGYDCYNRRKCLCPIA